MGGTAGHFAKPYVVDGAWFGSGTLTTWTRTLTGADQAFEALPNMTPVTISRAGIWVCTFEVRGFVEMPVGDGLDRTGVLARFAVNGAAAGGLPIMAAYGATSDTPSAAQSTATHVQILRLQAGDVLHLQAARTGQIGSATVANSPTGLTQMTGFWIAPATDAST